MAFHWHPMVLAISIQTEVKSIQQKKQ